MVFEKRGELFIGKFPELFNRNDIVHGISTRHGGVSQYPYHSLNLGSTTGDSSKNVDSNRASFFSAMRVDNSRIAIPNQVHSTHVLPVTAPGYYPDADGLITGERNIFLLIQVADCMPVFLVDFETPAVGLVHAGWRGVAGKILTVAIKKMEQNYGTKPKQLQVFIGPSIDSCCYEIGAEFSSFFPKKYLIKSHLNLFHVVRDELLSLHLPNGNIHKSHLCTSCRTDFFFSHRKEKGVTGRIMGLIGIK